MLKQLQKIGTKKMAKLYIKGFPVSQNGQDFIIGKAPIEEVLQYTCYTERLIINYDDDGRPIYNERVQRKVEKNRVEKIADFLINDDTATFPTNIILNIPQSIIECQNTTDGIICIGLKDEVVEEVKKAKSLGTDKADIFVSIIDGQHRVRGIEVAISRLEDNIRKNKDDKQHVWEEKLRNILNMDLVVSCFIDKTLEYQAMIFSTINRTQKRVSQDLVTSLFGLSTSDTPYKTALEVVLALNGHKKSPFYQRIKLYGGDYDTRMSPPLSQATMVKSIVNLISVNLRESENDKYRKRKELKVNNSKKNLPFRDFYASNEDNKIADCMFYFFNSVRKFFPHQWQYNGQSKPQNILQSTVGYDALMHIMSDILRTAGFQEFTRDCFDGYIDKIKSINVTNVQEFPMSTAGRKIFYYTIFIKIFPKDSSVQKKKQEIDSLRKR